MTDLSLAGNWLQLPHDNSHQCGLSFTVPAHKCDFFTSPDFNFSITEHHFLRITDRQVSSFEYHITGTRGRRKLHHQCRIVRFIYFDSVQFLQSLDSGLHLIGLCRLITEFIDEILGLFYHLLLILVSGNLLLHTLLAQFKIFRVRHFVIMDMPHHDFYGAIGDIVQETSVVRDKKN